MHLVDHHEAAGLIVKVQFGLIEHLAVGSSLHVEINGVTTFRDPLRQRRLAGLPWPEKDGTGLDFQGLFEGTLEGALNHTLQKFHTVEDLHGFLKLRIVHSSAGKATKIGA